MVSDIRWQKTSGWRRWKRFFLSELERHCQLQRSRVGHVPEVERRNCSLRRSKRIRCTQAGSSVEGSRGQRRSYGCWRIRAMERTNLFQRKGKEPNWQRKGDRKRWCKIIGTSNTQKIQGQCWNCGKTGHQSKDCWARATAAESRTVKFSWKGK